MKEEKLEIYKKIIEDYNTGNFKLKDLQKKYSIKYDTISKNIRKLGIKTNPHGKFPINSNSFNKIDNEEKAYWLGFLYADGNVHLDKKSNYVIELTLKQSDLNHIEKFKEFLKSKHNIYYKEKVKAYRISFLDKQIGLDLIKLGCIPAKSLILKFPTEEQVPSHLIHHFIRGYFDGDGYISNFNKNKSIVIGILGTYEFIEDLCKVANLNFKKILKKDKRHKNNTYFISMSGETARKFGQFIYQNCTVFLDRKKKNFEEYPKEYYRDDVEQYDLEGNLIAEYYNGSTAAKETGISHSSISLSCYRGIPIKGFKFKFKNR